MAFYTTLTTEQVTSFIEPYNLGGLVGFEGIDGGIENTNYFVTTENDAGQQTYVLTLFEEIGLKELPYFKRLTTHIADNGLPVPAPLKDRDEKVMKTLADRPALLFRKFPGKQIIQPEVSHCAQMGRMLGKIHKTARYFPLMREAHRGRSWWEAESQRVIPHLNDSDAALLHEQVEAYKTIAQQGWELPQGTIHGDLFVDNVLFVDGDMSAVIDFYNACTGYLLFDVAVTLNDWCVDEDGKVIDELATAFIHAYMQERPFTDDEHAAWPLMLRTAAMRFWLSRLITFHRLEEQNYEAERVIKDPDEYRRILINHLTNEPPSLTS